MQPTPETRRSGVLVAVEGIDGAGKTTQVERLVRFFKSFDVAVTNSREPTAGAWGQRIRESAGNGRLSLAEEIRCFTEDRREHVANVIIPALERDEVVILDRYFYSTIAYQGARGGDVAVLTESQRAFAPEPDITVVIDVPPHVGLARIRMGRKETPNEFETLENLTQVRNIFQQLIGSVPTVIRIDGTPDADSVESAIEHALTEGPASRPFCAKPWGCDEPLLCSYRRTGGCLLAKLRGYGVMREFRR